MAKKTTKKKSAAKGGSLANLERLVRAGFQQVDRRFEQVDQRFEQVDHRFAQIDQHFRTLDTRMGALEFEVRDLKRDIDERFRIVDERIDNLANHVDGFIKLHETLDIEFKVIKEQMSRLEVRLARLEAARAG